jgi:hypothetical protein
VQAQILVGVVVGVILMIIGGLATLLWGFLAGWFSAPPTPKSDPKPPVIIEPFETNTMKDL